MSNSLLMLSCSTNETLVNQIRTGLDGALLGDFLVEHAITKASFAKSVGISTRKLSRCIQEIIKGEDAAKIFRYVRVFDLTIQTFGSSQKAIAWLERPNRSLHENVAPASLLDSEFGAELIADALNRIKHGVFF